MVYLVGCYIGVFGLIALQHIRIYLKYGVHDFCPDRQTDGQREIDKQTDGQRDTL